jgi:hypothetical protein
MISPGVQAVSCSAPFTWHPVVLACFPHCGAPFEAACGALGGGGVGWLDVLPLRKKKYAMATMMSKRIVPMDVPRRDLRIQPPEKKRD